MEAIHLLLIAVYGQVALTFWAFISAGRARIAALKAGNVKLADIAIETEAYPPHVRLAAHNLRNQFETPVLFFAAAAIALALGAVTWAVALAALVFLVTRVLHRRIHLGDNHLRRRFMMFCYGLAALGAMWILIAIEVLRAG